MPKPYVVSFSNQKGGVGKTTSCISIASAAADMGLSVLLVDMDPQGNSTSGVGVQKKKISRSVYDVLLGECTAEEAVIKTEFKNLSLIPSTINLAGAEFELIDMEQRENCLKNALSALDGYDLVVIDCPPSLSMLTVNALTASAGGVEVFRLVHIHGFLLHLLLSSLVGSSGVLFTDSRGLRCKRRLLNLVLLLFYRYRSQKQLYYKCKEKYRRQVVVCEGIRKSQYIAHRYIQDIENTFH